MPVWVGHTGDDSVGVQLVRQIQEGLRRSTGLRLAGEDEHVPFGLQIVTLAAPRGAPRPSTTYSVVWTLADPSRPFLYYLSNVVGSCSGDRVEGCARDLVADTDEAVSAARRHLANYGGG